MGRRGAWAASWGLILPLLCAGTAAAQPAVQLWTLDAPRLVFSAGLEAGQAFTLEHQNSIYLAPVRETYRLGPQGGLRQIALESPSAGVFEYYGFDPPAAGRVLLEQSVGPIRLRSMSYEHHRLLLGERIINLKDLVQAGQPLLLKVVTP